MSTPVKAGFNPLSQRSFISAAAFDTQFFTYDTTTSYGSLVPVSGATPGTCPAGRILRETGRRLYPDVNPGITSAMVAVYDEVSFLTGYIDPNSTVFAVYNTKNSYTTPQGYIPFTSTLNSGPPVYTQGPVTGTYIAGAFLIPQLYNPSFPLVPYNNTTANAYAFINPYLANVFQIDITSAQTALTGTIRCFLRDPTSPTQDLVPPSGELIGVICVNNGPNSPSLYWEPGVSYGFYSANSPVIATNTSQTFSFALNGINAFEIGTGSGGTPLPTPPSGSSGQYLYWNGSAWAYGSTTVRMGLNAGSVNQGLNAIAIGEKAGMVNQLPNSIVLNASGNELDASTTAGLYISPVRYDATQTQTLLYNSTTKEVVFANASGLPAASNQGDYLYYNGSAWVTGYSTITLGDMAGATNQGDSAVALGAAAGNLNQGAYSVAIGAFAGLTNQSTNSIVINATASTLNASTNSGLFIAPIRSPSEPASQLLTYNPSTFEIVHTINPMPYLTASPSFSAFGRIWNTNTSYTADFNNVSISGTGQYQTAAAGSGTGSGLWTSSDYGVTWTLNTSPGTAGLYWYSIAVSHTGQYQTALVYQGALWTSSNYGVTWTQNTSAPATNALGNGQSVAMSSTGQYQTFVTYAGLGQLGAGWTSSNYGVTWTRNTSLPASSGEYYDSVSISSTGQYQIVGSDNDYVYLSKDFGKTWARTTAPSSGNWYGTAISATGQYQSAASASFGSIYGSSDYGKTWAVTLSNALRGWNIAMSATGQYQATSCGGSNSREVISSDYGKTWQIISSGLSYTTYISMSACGQYITYVGTNKIVTCSNNMATGVTTDKIALGYGAGRSNQGTNAIAIGQNAGVINQFANSIILNASGTTLDATTNSGLFVAPIRSLADTGNTLQYNPTTFELSYVAKTFVIDHPKNPSKYLVHACLEGPEAGVYYRGTSAIAEHQTSQTITLPDYVDALATEFTIHVTPIYNGTPRLLNVSRIQNNQFHVYGPHGEFDWHVYGKRLSIAVEPDKTSANVQGQGPYRWIV